MAQRIIGLAADHAGFFMKELIKAQLIKEGFEVVDFGTHSDASVDYPDYAHQLGNAIDSGACTLGFAFCGSGNGINMAMNKHARVRSALCWMPEIASMARAHNNANVCAVPSRYISAVETAKIVQAFLETAFEGGRHQNRIDKIAAGCI